MVRTVLPLTSIYIWWVLGVYGTRYCINQECNNEHKNVILVTNTHIVYSMSLEYSRNIQYLTPGSRCAIMMVGAEMVKHIYCKSCGKLVAVEMIDKKCPVCGKRVK
ncbi:hypothetical protein HYZ97_03665 [Candidatus Pacearchaeota archaeon]|nr:hypothetical protein [Candidatus Pacearchaeota archaeon]